jgi:hypothetical protein
MTCAPLTWYSATNPTDEFFPEAFMLWRISPEWLRANRSEVADWFATKL